MPARCPIAGLLTQTRGGLLFGPTLVRLRSGANFRRYANGRRHTAYEHRRSFRHIWEVAAELPGRHD